MLRISQDGFIVFTRRYNVYFIPSCNKGRCYNDSGFHLRCWVRCIFGWKFQVVLRPTVYREVVVKRYLPVSNTRGGNGWTSGMVLFEQRAISSRNWESQSGVLSESRIWWPQIWVICFLTADRACSPSRNVTHMVSSTNLTRITSPGMGKRLENIFLFF